MNCPREYFFGYVLHRRARETSAALSFGDIWHKILELHYKTGADVVAVREGIFLHTADKPSSGEDYRTLDRALMDYEKYYLKKWPLAKDIASTIGFPDNPMVELKVSMQGEPLIHPYAGKIDRLFEEDGLVYVEDHKTTSRFDKHFFKQFELSNQMKGYTTIGGHILPSRKVAGVRINAYHCLTTKTDFYRQVITFSKAQLDEWAENYNKWIVRLRMDYFAWRLSQGATPDELGLDPVLVDFLRRIEPFPAHFGDNGCSRKFGMCTYYGVCSLPPRVHMKALEMDFDVKPWNPLDHDDKD
jgi:hypothetical protein